MLSFPYRVVRVNCGGIGLKSILMYISSVFLYLSITFSIIFFKESIHFFIKPNYFFALKSTRKQLSSFYCTERIHNLSLFYQFHLIFLLSRKLCFRVLQADSPEAAAQRQEDLKDLEFQKRLSRWGKIGLWSLHRIICTTFVLFLKFALWPLNLFLDWKKAVRITAAN